MTSNCVKVPPYERVRRDDMIAGGGEREKGDELSRQARRRGQPAEPAFEGSHAFLECGVRGVRQAAVDVAERLQRKQIGGVLRVFEDERGRRVDRHRTRPGLWVRTLSGVDGERVEAVARIGHSPQRHTPMNREQVGPPTGKCTTEPAISFDSGDSAPPSG